MTTTTDHNDKQPLDLEQLLHTLPEDQKHRATLRILENANVERIGPYRNTEAEEAARTLSAPFLQLCLDYFCAKGLFKPYEDRDKAIRLITENEGVRRTSSSLTKRGAEHLVAMAEQMTGITPRGVDVAWDQQWCQYMERAAHLYAESYLSRKAAELYELVEQWQNAGKQWENACEWEKASLDFEKAGDPYHAASCAEHYDINRAISIAVQGNELGLAITLAVRNDRYEEALDLCDRLSKEPTEILKAKAETAQTARKYDDAVRFYEQAGDLQTAARTAKKQNLPEATRLYETIIREQMEAAERGLANYTAIEELACEAERWDLAGEINEKQLNLKSAAYYFRRAGLTERAVEVTTRWQAWELNEGRFANAATATEELGDHARAEQYRYLQRITERKG